MSLKFDMETVWFKAGVSHQAVQSRYTAVRVDKITNAEFQETGALDVLEAKSKDELAKFIMSDVDGVWRELRPVIKELLEAARLASDSRNNYQFSPHITNTLNLIDKMETALKGE